MKKLLLLLLCVPLIGWSQISVDNEYCYITKELEGVYSEWYKENGKIQYSYENTEEKNITVTLIFMHSENAADDMYFEIIDKTNNNNEPIYWTKDDYGGVNTPLNPYSVSWYGFGRDDNGSLCFYEIKSPENSLYVKRRCVDRTRNNRYEFKVNKIEIFNTDSRQWNEVPLKK